MYFPSGESRAWAISGLPKNRWGARTGGGAAARTAGEARTSASRMRPARVARGDGFMSFLLGFVGPTPFYAGRDPGVSTLLAAQARVEGDVVQTAVLDDGAPQEALAGESRLFEDPARGPVVGERERGDAHKVVRPEGG